MNVFFHYFSTSDDFFPLAGEKRASVPYLLHRIARVSTTLHHHHHHPSPPPFCAGTPLFLFFSLPSVAPRRFGPRRAARASPRTGFHFFARMSLRDRMRLRFPMSPRKIGLITHASCRSCAANAPNRNARIAQPLALTTFTLLFATTARETETRKEHEVPHRRSAL